MPGASGAPGPTGPTGPQTVDLKFTAARGETVEVCFEPIGTTFSLFDGQSIYLRTPLATVGSVEVVSWPNGIGVWVPYPGDHLILDSERNELEPL
ncbi:hypothetical protein [Streptomyces prunicolor]|uniref:hypothetical protein n=1 Tax=Streptomyces prunicolor TaxID=67348 RepID=UPI000693B7DC|nr:hypothetical protein [Streptomyces prunicolor]MCX5235302.1 hypothetical protein [Streptomyces prunicolor]